VRATSAAVRYNKVEPCHSRPDFGTPMRDERPPASTTPAATPAPVSTRVSLVVRRAMEVAKSASKIDRENQLCAPCKAARSTASGEHVLPKAFMKACWPSDRGPYTVLAPTETRFRQQFDSIILPCCKRCNETLESRFESTGCEPAIRLFNTVRPNLTAVETESVALWILKTWLLLAHPAAEYRSDTPRVAAWEGAPDEVFTWLVNDRPPPAGLSAWAHFPGLVQ
jgi:hypothetical protein